MLQSMFRRLAALAAASTLALTSLLLTPASASALTAKSTACTDLIVLGARGSGAGMSDGSVYGFGRVLSPIATNMVSRVKRSGTYRFAALPYEAAPYGIGSGYDRSVQDGGALGASIVGSLAAKCPGSRFALLGHSQGAQVWRLAISKMSTTARSRIVAVGLVGDPRRRGFAQSPSEVGYHETFNTGAFANSGVFGAGTPFTSWLTSASSKVATFCPKGDHVCNTGGTISEYWHSTFYIERSSSVGYGIYTRLAANGFR